MAEWLKAHAWKACIPQGIQGSNPCLSATLESTTYVEHSLLKCYLNTLKRAHFFYKQIASKAEDFCEWIPMHDWIRPGEFTNS
jgi:hypothetical protein